MTVAELQEAVRTERALAQQQFIMVTGGETLARELQEQGWLLYAAVDKLELQPDGKIQTKFSFSWVAPDEMPGVQSEDGEEKLT